MRLHEYQSKELLRKYGVQTPRGYPCFHVPEVVKAVRRIGKSLVKPQIHLAGGKPPPPARTAASKDEAQVCAEQIFNTPVEPSGVMVKRILVEEAVAGKPMYRLDVTADAAGAADSWPQPLRLTIYAQSNSDGAPLHDESLAPGVELSEERALAIFRKLSLPEAATRSTLALLTGTCKMASERGAQLLRIDPVMLTDRGAVLASGVVVEFTEQSLITHPEIGSMRDPDAAD